MSSNTVQSLTIDMNMTLKENVHTFNQDVAENRGYKYTTNAPYSSVVANDRLTKATIDKIPSGKISIIDIGCGDGTYTNEIKIGRPNSNICGFDPAVSATELAKKSYPEIDFFVSDILKKESLPDKKFDLAILRGVLHHVRDQEVALRNTALIADKVLILEPNGNNPILKIIEKLSPYHRAHEEQSFSSIQWRTWCRNTGWEIESLEYVGFVPFFFPTGPAKVIHFFQPMLEKIPFLNKYFSAVLVFVCVSE